VIIPASATSTFKENQYLVDEAMGCMPVTVPTLASQTRLHPVTRIPDSKYIVVIFSKTGVSDTLDIAVAQQATTTVPAETIVASAFDCSTAGTSAACTGCNATDVHDAGLGTPSPCNTTCWLSDCAFFPFENYTNEVRIVGVAKTGKQVKIAYINKAAAFTGIKINVSTSPTCGTGTLFTSRCANANQCGAGECDYGDILVQWVIKFISRFRFIMTTMA
jgi:hypothetical protein